MGDFIPKSDREAVAYINRALVQLALTPLAYGVAAAKITELEAKRDDAIAKLDASDAAQAASKVAVSAKDAAMLALLAAFRPVVAQVQVNPDVTDESRTTAGLPIRDTVRTVSAPIVPRDLVARADASGINALTWNANGNPSGIRYVVQAKLVGAADFTTVDVVTATSFQHRDQRPGVMVTYRVRARRGDVDSAPSNTAQVYA
jgi:hypothetical protein